MKLYYTVVLPLIYATPGKKVIFLFQISIEDTLAAEQGRHITMAQILLQLKQKKMKTERW